MSENNSLAKAVDLIRLLRDDTITLLIISAVFISPSFLAERIPILQKVPDTLGVIGVIPLAVAISNLVTKSFNLIKSFINLLVLKIRKRAESKEAARKIVTQNNVLDNLYISRPEDIEVLYRCFVDNGLERAFNVESIEHPSAGFVELRRHGLITTKILVTRTGVSNGNKIILSPSIYDRFLDTYKSDLDAQKKAALEFDAEAEAKLELLDTQFQSSEYLVKRLLSLVHEEEGHLNASHVDVPLHALLKQMKEVQLIQVEMNECFNPNDRLYWIRIPKCVRFHMLEKTGLHIS